MRTIPLLAALLAFALPPVLAQAETQPAAATPNPAKGDPQQAADLTRVEAYLNGLTTAQASFTMVAPDGQQSKGQFYLSRPAKLRFEYTEPKGNLLIADGDYVIYWDAQQKEASNLPISQTPLAFLLKPHVSLSDSAVRITRFEHAAGVIRVSLVQAKDASAGSVTVAFSDQPAELRGWRLVDAQGQTTDVTFSDWKLGVSLDSSLFHFESPYHGKPHR